MISIDLSPFANHLWQSTLFGVAVWLITLTLGNNRASVRHRMWFAASAKFLLPFSLLTAVGSQFQWRTAPAPAPAPSSISIAVDAFNQPFTASATPPIAAATTPAEPTRLPFILFTIWICGSTVTTMWWFVRWLQLRSVVRRATPLNLDAPIRVLSCAKRLEPGVLGIFRPVLLLPTGISARLSAAQMQAVVAHELCHVRRRDNLTATIHMIVEALFWFHPMVWWLRLRLIEEQERACDEEVLRLGGDPQIYAESILKICEWYLTSPLICVSGTSGSNLKKRISAIMKNQNTRKLSLSHIVLLVVAAITTVAGPILFAAVQPAQLGQLAFETAYLGPATPEGPPQWVRCTGIDGTLDQFGIRNTLPRLGPGEFAPVVVRQGTCLGRSGLTRLISLAYGVHPTRISGLSEPMSPGTPLGELLYQIEARASNPSTATTEQLQRMLQSLLMDRFKLRVHRQTRVVPGYALRVGPNGIKFREIVGEEQLPGEEPGQWATGTWAPVSAAISGRFTLERLADALWMRMGKPVIDMTGLRGTYDISLTHHIPVTVTPGPGGQGKIFRSLSTPESTVADAARSVEEQLGLRLDFGNIPVEFLVIDQFERPAAN